MPTAHAGYAKLNSDTPIRLHAPGRFLPIVFVPGIMGTRLNDPPSLPTDDRKGTLVWNPTGFPFSIAAGATPGPFACDYERLQQVTAELLPDENYTYDDKASRDAVQHIKHYYNAVTPFYDTVLKALAMDGPGDYLAAHADYGKYNIKPKVYFCGYDWRRDNAASAFRLASVVDEALADTGESKVILVAHSMGGLVSRYYCKMLGGESKVFALFLLGSPSLGAIEAYTQLKHGLNAPYAREFFNTDPTEQGQDDDVASAATSDVASAVTQAAGAAAALAQGAAGLSALGDAAQGFLCKLYLLLCLGAGRLLTRKEIIYFVRQLPSLYQLLPTANFCRNNKNWLIFDPLNSGHPASGFLIRFPTLLDIPIITARGVSDGLDAAAHQTGYDLRNTVDGVMNPSTPADPGQSIVRNEALLSANSTNLLDMVVDLVAGSRTPQAAGKTTAIIQALVHRITDSFIDCRSSHALYDDIFTGLRDVPELRAISNANLQVAYNFDDALTANARMEKPKSAKELLMVVLAPVLALLATSEGKGKTKEEGIADARNPPKTYMHPKTIVYWSATLAVDGGSFLLCERVISRYDTNVVNWDLLPNLLGLVGTPPAGTAASTSSDGVIAFGDATVPFYSAKPPDSILTNPVDPLSHGFPGVVHADMAKSSAIVTKLKNDIAGLQKDWWNQ
jgi:pimeloyl-ACP methyl ester carboxylesterase